MSDDARYITIDFFSIPSRKPKTRTNPRIESMNARLRGLRRSHISKRGRVYEVADNIACCVDECSTLVDALACAEDILARNAAGAAQ